MLCSWNFFLKKNCCFLCCIHLKLESCKDCKRYASGISM
uniref:Uncharacterized protein n=1 Tax=Setaria viridis TaxID=4556 RepID=A0A4U6VEL0_SETVI|nr:hypothetical protein SEVIR_4G232602v2 [Setaria viridis]